MVDSWMVVSDKELELGKKIANDICDNYESTEDCLDAMPIVVTGLAERVLWGKPFADRKEEITGNLLTQVAYSISEKKMLNEDNGVVLTSNILAEDMVRVSLVEWLTLNTDVDRKHIINFVYDNDSLYKEVLKAKCIEIKWYDPCVGGGVFPLSIIQVYKEMGIDKMPAIYGFDLDPFYVCATKMRIALIYGQSVMSLLDERIITGDALDSHLQQYNLFSCGMEENYDVVIGNPPYIRGEAIEKGLRSKYASNYPELENKSTDLYTYFICHGINSLSDNGVLTFVTPAQFQVSKYGKPIRKVIKEKCDLKIIADFDELPVFKNIGVHTSVYCLAKNKNNEDFIRYEYTDLPCKRPFAELYKNGFRLPQKNVDETGWIFSSQDARTIIDHIESKGIILSEYSGGVYSGIKTGCKKAFLLHENEIDEKFTEYDLAHIRKMLIPKNIKAWKSNWKDEYLLIIKKDEIIDENSEIYKRVLGFKEELSNRSDVEGHATWYGLRECGYYDKFEEPKIIYPDISTECRFTMDIDAKYIPDGAFFIPGEDYYLLGILNSCVGRYYFKQKCARIGNPKLGGRIRFKKVYVEQFPVVLPDTSPELASKITRIAQNASNDGFISEENLKELDEAVLKMYEIPEEYVKVLRES